MNLFRKTSIASDPVVRRSSLTISEALEAARQAGLQTPDTGLFDRWLRAKGLSSRGSILVSRMRQEYEQAFEERFNGQIAFSRKADLTSPRSGAGHLGGGSQAYSDGNCPKGEHEKQDMRHSAVMAELGQSGRAVSVQFAGGSQRPAPENQNHCAVAAKTPIIVHQPADPRKLNRLFLERQKGGDASRTRSTQGLRNEGGSNPPSIPPKFPAGEPRAVRNHLATGGMGLDVTGDDPAGSISALYASGKASSLKEAMAILGGAR